MEVTFGQGFKDMSPPAKEMFKLLMEGNIIHGGNPVLRWMAGNVVMRQDPSGNIKPDKKNPSKNRRICGVYYGYSLLHP